mgnify:CR=1 FL=1
MRLEDFEQMWNDWLRGTVLVGIILLLVVLYSLDVLTKPNFALVMTGTLLVVAVAASLQYCLDVPVPRLLAVVSPIIGGLGAVVVFITIQGVLKPPPPFAEVQVSAADPMATLAVPEEMAGEVYVWVHGTPGALPSGDDRTITAGLDLTQGERHKTFHIELLKGAKNKGKGKGIAISDMTSELFRMDGLVEGDVQVKLDRLKPPKALPLKITFHKPAFPTSLAWWVVAFLLLATIVVSLFTLKGRLFPFILPFSLVMVVVQHLAAQGFSPTEPLLPLLGILMGGGILTSAVGYLLGKGLSWVTGKMLTVPAVGKTGGKKRKSSELDP